jgi:hypothetical protein
MSHSLQSSFICCDQKIGVKILFLGGSSRLYIKMDLTEIVWGGMDLTELAQDRDQWALMNMAMNLGVS